MIFFKTCTKMKNLIVIKKYILTIKYYLALYYLCEAVFYFPHFNKAATFCIVMS